MTACVHPDLHVEEGTSYRCATCGQGFVVLKVDESREVAAVDEAQSVPEGADVSGQIGPYVSPDRRLPSRKR